MRYWWVNQGQTFREETTGGFMWSPKRNIDGRPNHSYDLMQDVRPGDIVLSYWDTAIRAVGIAAGIAHTSPRPEFKAVAPESWDTTGWFVPVEYRLLPKPIFPKPRYDDLRPLMGKYPPLNARGNGNQTHYLIELSEALFTKLADLIGNVYDDCLSAAAEQAERRREAEAETDQSDDAGVGNEAPETIREQLVLARRGQGVFKANVRNLERGCRITGVSDPTHLRASHIKPWAKCNNSERLDGANGLLLAPHVDHLFDRGLISFCDSGELLTSSVVDPSVLAAWHIPHQVNVGQFGATQTQYLAWHREHVFRA